jgi:outer membrane protein TolC
MRRYLTLFLALTGAIAFAQAPGPAARQLSLQEAIRLAIQNNLSSRLAKAQTEEGRGLAIQAASDLLPHFLGSIQQSRVFKINFEAEGFPPNSNLFNPILGPYNVFDARIQLTQKIIDMASLWRTRAGLAGIGILQMQEDLVDEQLAAAAALAYTDTLRAQQAVAAAQANLTLAQDLLTQTQHEHRAGIATGVDLARSETQVSQQNVGLIRAQVAARQADLRLKRLIGISLGEPIELVDKLGAGGTAFPSENEATQIASTRRIELEITKERLRADQLLLDSARFAYLPSVSASADYGFSGNLPAGSARTGSIGGRLSLPIFTGGEIEGAVRQARGQRDDSQARYVDTQAQVEEDARLSVQTLGAEVEEVKSADQTVKLAERELKMARDRFAAGAGDNIQVIQAQTVLAQAREDEVESLARYNTARVNLAAALGEAQKFKL